VRAPKPFVIGLTGAIGMGKSQTAKLFAAESVPVFDADAVIHDLYAGDAAAMIEAAFPGSTKNGAVDRAALGRQVLDDKGAMTRLEQLVHPLVARRREEFLARATAPIVVLDIPLLLETGTKVDAVVVATAPEAMQRQRVLAAHYLCLLEPGTPLFNTSAPAWRQQRLLAKMT